MIATSAQDQVSIASEELNQYLEDQANAIASAEPAFVSSALKTAPDWLKSLATSAAASIQQVIKETVAQAWKIGRMLLDVKQNLKKVTEYRIVLSALGWTSVKANKYVKLVKTFEGFTLSQFLNIELTTLFALCTKTYSGVVEQLRPMPCITQELVERLIKENRLSRKPKPQSDPITGWKQNKSGGGRHYNVLLHDEDTGVKIEDLAQKQNVLPQKVVAEAVSAWHINQMSIVPPAKVEQSNFWDWGEVAAVMKRDHDCLLNTVKNWTPEERASLGSLLSAHLQENPQALDSELSWVPKSLINKALSTLSFTLTKIGGANNCVDEPYLEKVLNCRFVFLEYPCSKNEQWIFCDANDRRYPVFGRDEFEIERRDHCNTCYKPNS